MQLSASQLLVALDAMSGRDLRVGGQVTAPVFQGAAPDSVLFILHVSTCIFGLKEKEEGEAWGRLS